VVTESLAEQVRGVYAEMRVLAQEGDAEAFREAAQRMLELLTGQPMELPAPVAATVMPVVLTDPRTAAGILAAFAKTQSLNIAEVERRAAEVGESVPGSAGGPEDGVVLEMKRAAAAGDRVAFGAACLRCARENLGVSMALTPQQVSHLMARFTQDPLRAAEMLGSLAAVHVVALAQQEASGVAPLWG